MLDEITEMKTISVVNLTMSSINVFVMILSWLPVFQYGYDHHLRPMYLGLVYFAYLAVFLFVFILQFSDPMALKFKLINSAILAFIPIILPIMFTVTGGLSFKK